MSFQFIPRSNVLGAITLKNPYGDRPAPSDCPPRHLKVGDLVELYYPMVGGDREPVPEAWVRYVVEDVSPTDQVTLMPCEPTPRYFAFFMFADLDPTDLPSTITDDDGEVLRLVHRPGRPPAYQAERGSILRRSLDKSLSEHVDWRRVQEQIADHAA